MHTSETKIEKDVNILYNETNHKTTSMKMMHKIKWRTSCCGTLQNLQSIRNSAFGQLLFVFEFISKSALLKR